MNTTIIHRLSVAALSLWLAGSGFADVPPTNGLPTAAACPECKGSGACAPCQGQGSARCQPCGGDGKTESKCSRCNGRGRTTRTSRISGRTRRSTSTCSTCSGRGRRSENCTRCGSDGKVTCTKCDGTKKCARCQKKK